jgi:RNA polymerase sigma-70 factor (ECF subfamily)
MNTSATDVPKKADHSGVFFTTHWSVVLAAGDGKTPAAQDALEQLCRTYWHPLYVYVRRRGYAREDAEDLTQAFFAWLLERGWLGAADQQRGRFRSFLLTSFSRFAANEWDKSMTEKRGGRVVSLPFEEADAGGSLETADKATPEQIYERRWALTLLDRVMDRLADEFARDGKTDLFAALKPCLLGERTQQPYALLAEKLGITEGSVKVLVFRLRGRYRQLLRDEIASTVARPEEIEGELHYLFAVLARR